MSSLLLPDHIDESWKTFLTPDKLIMLNEIEHKLTDNINPDRKNILRFLKVNLTGIKVVILGQDPYPQQGMATGRAFEVGGLCSWNQSFRQVSLKNILRLLYKNHRQITLYKDIYSFSRVQHEISKGEFPVFPPDKLFESWEKQGVLLLNTSFTCNSGDPGSHEHIWFEFSKQLISYISSFSKMHWFLWGKHACGKRSFIDSGILYISRHPMMCSEKYEDDFLKSDCFLNTGHLIQWLGQT